MADAPLVEMKNVSKAFGGVHAVEDVTVHVSAGEVLGIVGHNGAGKSTLIKILSGAHTMDSGQLLMRGEPVSIDNPRVARALGIETLYQNLALADNLDAAANLFLGRELTTPYGKLDNKTMADATREVIARINPQFANLGTPVLHLSGGQRQTIAVARAVYFNAKVLIMDEPTAALGLRESAAFKELVLRLKQEGIGMFMISHDLHDVFDISDRIFVMSGGREVGTRRTDQVTKDQVLSMIILGKQAGEESAEDLAKLH